ALRVMPRGLLDDGAHAQRLAAAGELALDVAEHGHATGHAAHVVHDHAPARALHHAAVADLPARLDVERVLPELEREAPVLAAVRDDVRLDRRRLVAHELLLRVRHELLPAGGERGRIHAFRRARLVRHAGALALLLERALEPGQVHGVAALARHQLDQVQRVAERVVEAERVHALDHGPRTQPRVDRAALLVGQLGGDLVEALHAGIDGLEEALLLEPG